MPAQDPTRRIVENLFFLQRYGNGLDQRGRALLGEMFDDIVAILRRIDPTGPRLERWQRHRLERLLEAIRPVIAENMEAWRRLIRDDLAELGASQATWARATLVESLGGAAAMGGHQISLGDPTGLGVNFFKSIIDTNPFEGDTLAEWAERQGRRTLIDARKQLRLGLAEQETIPQMVRRLQPVLDKTQRQTEAVVRTAVNEIATTAHMETYEGNQDITPTFTYVATLDSRTCFVAGTIVATADGDRPIEQIRAGETVIGGSGLLRRVVATRECVKTEMSRVHLSSGETVECTVDHLWLTEGQEWTEARGLRPGQRLAQRLETAYLTGHESLSSMRQEVRAKAQQGEQVLRPSVLPDRSKTGRLRGVSSPLRDVRPMREGVSANRSPEVLLPRLLPVAPHAKGGVAVRGMRDHESRIAGVGEAEDLLLARVPGEKQATASEHLSGLRRPPGRDVECRARKHLETRSVSVVRVERFTRPTPVYDLQVEKDHSFIVGGCVVHNSIICASLDGQIFRYDDPNAKRPPQHFACRSSIAPNIDWQSLGLDPPEEALRASADGPVKGTLDYEQWLRDQPDSVQDKVLGPERAKLFRSGDKSLRDMVTEDGEVITVDQLRGGDA